MLDTGPIRPGAAAAADAPPSAAARSELEAVARDFEALLVAELLKAARASGAAAWTGGEDAAADSALGMAEQEFARAIAAGGLGLARIIVEGLESATTRSNSAPPSPVTVRR